MRSFRAVTAIIASLTLTGAVSAVADDVALSDTPMFIASSADPNLMFILDDSGSMRWGFMPDSLVDAADIQGDDDTGNEQECSNYGSHAGMDTCFYSVTDRKFMVSNETNNIYYDPGRTYEPPLKSDGTRYPDVDFRSAPVDGYAADNGSNPEEVDLATDYRAIMDPYYYYQYHRCNGDEWCLYDGFTVGSTSSGSSGEGAFYYEMTEDSCDQASREDSCFSDRQEPQTVSEQQNFANWFAYYRTRRLSSIAGITKAFFNQPDDMRIGYYALNSDNNRGVRGFSGDDRDAFFDWLQTSAVGGSTPLRTALDNIGQYYERTDDQGPWADDPGASDGQSVDAFAECRQSFSILMTDGYYGTDNPDPGNLDGEAGPVIEGPNGESYQYTPTDPFQDDYADTLADVAMNYWVRDLQPNVANRVPVEEDQHMPAFWQHMITYGVGLGVEGTITETEAESALANGTSVDWPDPDGNDEAKIDDLLHAGINSRGGFFSADDPETFDTELSGILADIAEIVGSSTSVTFDTATLEEDSLLFGARFDSGPWTGDLDARPLNTDENLENPEVGDPVWSAAEQLDARDWQTRQIMTMANGTGIPLAWDETVLTTEQVADLRFGTGTEAEKDARAADRVAYLRGDQSQEGQETGDFRQRESLLGDIVNSTPVRVSEPASAWPDSEKFGEENNRYSDFRAEYADRTPIIYAGANDGLLHGFKATEDGGDEVFAFMPSAIFSDQAGEGLHYLTSQSYQHNYYVDLPPLVSDAFIKGRDQDGNPTATADWRTVLLGGSRFGEKAIFALDVTDPSALSESNAASTVLWEFTEANDDRMGYISEPPTIAKAYWGNQKGERWTAFFGNGYNSDTDATGFFMLDLEGGLDGQWTEGDDYRFVTFESGTDATGLSAVAVYDQSGDGVADRVYGGDLDGDFWVAESSNQGFASPYEQSNSPLPLFDGTQPITSAPLIIPNNNIHPKEGEPELYVLFGTGQYLNNDDLSDTSNQSFYAVRDVGASGIQRGDLAERTLSEKQGTPAGAEILISEATGNTDPERGWYVDLFTAGERITLSPQVRGEYIFVNSTIPSDNPCVAGGSTRVMAFGLGGLTPDRAVFAEYGDKVTSYRKVDGIASQSAFLGDYRFTPLSTGEVDVEETNIPDDDDRLGRQGWQELIE
ncbi:MULTISPECIES: pilus assembly protein [Halomonadaceae]|uniref:PilY1 beta-propeller domain-containing protein n=1 Tax=Vreelandella halophila TaxID=86177 RepID=A0A9X4YDL8_9GAMM|nr:MULTISPECIES: PilC/PilY family type IV pilus protein [Halomonas]MYL27754.1 hypothetical protein [Halomonas utahensis]MYL75484.1 hypothetical protein [Halomonas sp. 22501_18_FS]